MWLALNYMDPTWEVLQKNNFIGPSWCRLCQPVEKTIDHLFMTCPLSKEVWN